MVCVTPPYEGDLDLLDLGLLKTDVQTMLQEPCDKALAAAEKLAKDEDASIKTICEIGQPQSLYSRDFHLARGCKVERCNVEGGNF